MKIHTIKNLIRKDVPIYYRRVFSGTLIIELMTDTVECNIDFTVETKPTGSKEVIIDQMDKVDYPLLPLKKEIKKFIISLDKTGGLPG